MLTDSSCLSVHPTAVLTYLGNMRSTQMLKPLDDLVKKKVLLKSLSLVIVSKVWSVSSFALGRIGIGDVFTPLISIILCLTVTREKYFNGLNFTYNIQFEDLVGRSLTTKNNPS